MPKNVMLIGGIYHPFEEAVPMLSELFAKHGIETVVTTDVAEAVEELAGADIFTLYALRWRMLNDEKYGPFRDTWAFELPEASADAIYEFVEAGGGMLGLHTASICFDTWYDFKQLLGGVWRWDQTFHPERSLVSVEPVGSHPIVDDIRPFEVDDEVYHQLDCADGNHVLARARVSNGEWQTVAWAREVGEGRVVYNALGHDRDSLSHPTHTQLLDQAIAWLAG